LARLVLVASLVMLPPTFLGRVSGSGTDLDELRAVRTSRRRSGHLHPS
jgi:hypothetical protein